MSEIKGLFFDLDGTLVDTIEANIKAYTYAAKKVGHTLDQKELASTFGMRSDQFLKKLLKDISEEDIKAIQKIKAESYKDFSHLITPNHILIDFLRTLKPDHITVLVTTASRSNVNLVLKIAGIENLFDFVITGDDVTNPKPHPEAYLKALELTGLSTEKVLAFEDSQTGLKSAESANLKTLLIKPFENKK